MFFFFQAEDGIRDRNVTGVQTCALPISAALRGGGERRRHGHRGAVGGDARETGGDGVARRERRRRDPRPAARVSGRPRRDPPPQRAGRARPVASRARAPLMPQFTAPDGTSLAYDVYEPPSPVGAVLFVTG